MSASFCDCVNQWEQAVGLQVLRDTKYLSLRTRGDFCLNLDIQAHDKKMRNIYTTRLYYTSIHLLLTHEEAKKIEIKIKSHKIERNP